jgi:GTP-binding protein
MSAARARSVSPVRAVSAEFEAGAVRAPDLPPAGCEEVAFVGRSNVGKSSLMNALVERRKLVRTSRTPGCTRQINLFAVKLADGRELRLVDLPGYGYAKLSKAERQSWGERLEAYVRTRASLGCVVLLVDARRGFEEDDAQMAEFVGAPRPGGPAPRLVVVATKIDKLASSRRGSVLLGIARQARVPAVGFSAVTGEGREELWAKILKSGNSQSPSPHPSPPSPQGSGRGRPDEESEERAASLATSGALR